MPFVDKTHAEFKWMGSDGKETMSYMWQVVVVVVVVVVVFITRITAVFLCLP
jgi:hypothetical protein